MVRAIARELGLLSPGRCSARITTTLHSLRMEHHEPSGMYVNWYDETDGTILRSGSTGAPVVPFARASTWAGSAPPCTWSPRPIPATAACPPL